jgi:hypothetical protein
LSRLDVVLLGNTLDLGVFEEERSTDGVVSEGRVSGNVTEKVKIQSIDAQTSLGRWRLTCCSWRGER